MSAIFVAIDWAGQPIDPSVLHAATMSVRLRCPDGAWAWADGPVGMAQADLATLPEDVPGAPIALGPLRIVASCRLDNRAELLAALPRSAGLRHAPDAALILAAYAAWGQRCPERLVGDFAFAIWDAAQQTLFAARDPSGARTLFFYADARRLVLASDRTQILQDPSIPMELDEADIVEYLTPSFQWFSGWDRGFFRGISALAAGSVLVARSGSVSRRQYWDWGDAEPERWSFDEAVEAYRHTLAEAVRCRLRSRTPAVGLELSGGLDSSAVACLAAGGDQQAALHAFSMVFDAATDVDERRHIQAVLARYPLAPHRLVADDLYAPECLSAGWRPTAITGPQELMVAAAPLRLYGLAASAGCRVLLSGEMGDALNDGSPLVYFDLLRRGAWAELLGRAALNWRSERWAVPRNLVAHGAAPWLPLPLLRAALALRDVRRGMADHLPLYLRPDLRERIREVDGALRAARLAHQRERCPARRDTLWQIVPPMPALTTPAAAPIERRHPYTDRRLVSLVLRLPQSFKWERGQPDAWLACRHHHRAAMEGLVPAQILRGNYGVDFAPAIRRCLSPGAIRSWLDGEPHLQIAERGYVDRQLFLEAVDRGEEPQGYLSTLLCLEAWLRSLAPGGAMRLLAASGRTPAAPTTAQTAAPPLAYSSDVAAYGKEVL